MRLDPSCFTIYHRGEPTTAPLLLPAPIAAMKHGQPSGWRGIWQRHRKAIIIGGLVALALSLAWGRLDLETLRAWTDDLPAWAVFAALVFLPLVGCPVSPLTVVVGMRFGFVGGFAATAAAIVLQHTLSWTLVHLAPGFFEPKLAGIRERIPNGAHAEITVFTALLPGAPYWAQIYVLPLIGVPWIKLMLVACPVHMVRSVSGIVFGQVMTHLTLGWIIVLGVYMTALVCCCLWTGNRLRRRLGSNKTSRA